jgi:hypothetical protein
MGSLVRRVSEAFYGLDISRSGLRPGRKTCGSIFQDFDGKIQSLFCKSRMEIWPIVSLPGRSPCSLFQVRRALRNSTHKRCHQSSESPAELYEQEGIYFAAVRSVTNKHWFADFFSRFPKYPSITGMVRALFQKCRGRKIFALFGQLAY